MPNSKPRVLPSSSCIRCWDISSGSTGVQGRIAESADIYELTGKHLI